jgi:hypothetical protein
MPRRPAAFIANSIEWLLLAVFGAFLALHTLPNAWRTLNTDFPNYYLSAQLAHQGYDTSQAYDWRWFQREKDHRGIDQRVVGLAPITPFSTLFVWPLTGLRPLQAKHIWLLLQLLLLIPIMLALRSLTMQSARRIALLTVICFPLHRNLLYGQYYILLLAMLAGACWAYHRKLSSLAGILVGLATMTKLFPAIFLLYFLRKRNGRALASTAITIAVCLAISLAVFGWPMHRYYLQSVLPWTLRGEALPPYLLSASSLSNLLHRLFLYEPQWNPHPWHNAPLAFAVLGPFLQMAILAPAILLIHPEEDRRSIPLEWSVLLCATLAISTSPASYNFTLLILPITVLCAWLMPRRPLLTLVAILLYLGIGYPSWNTSNVDGLRAILHEPRLLLLIALTFLSCLVLCATQASKPAGMEPAISLTGNIQQSRNIPWIVSLGLLTGIGIFIAVHHQHNLDADYPYRLPMQMDALLAAAPAYTTSTIEQIQLVPEGYVLNSAVNPEPDQLSFAPTPSDNWIEQVNGTSRLLPPSGSSWHIIEEARNPISSQDGRAVAYIHDDHGNGHLVEYPNITLSPAWMNVLEGSAMPDGSYVASASVGQRPPQIYRLRHEHEPLLMNLGTARYPSVSPDGRWMAFSRFQSGAWNLYLLDLVSPSTPKRLTDAACNQVEPAWEPDSKTLLYASDCGRALGFTAICRRRFLR